MATYGHRAAADLRGMKGDIYEAGHRVPYIVKWPGKVKPGSITHQTNSLAHFYATLADMFSTPSNALDSYSVLGDLMSEEGKIESKPIVHHSSRGHFALRFGDWKMIEKLGSGGFTSPVKLPTPEGGQQERLFNLKEDPSEKTDVSQKFPEQLELMKQKLDSIQQLNLISAR